MFSSPSEKKNKPLFFCLAFLFWKRKVSDNGDEGTPVPIPNTVVKLVYGDNTWLATAWEDNSSLTLKAVTSYGYCFLRLIKFIKQKILFFDKIRQIIK